MLKSYGFDRSHLVEALSKVSVSARRSDSPASAGHLRGRHATIGARSSALESKRRQALRRFQTIDYQSIGSLGRRIEAHVLPGDKARPRHERLAGRQLCGGGEFAVEGQKALINRGLTTDGKRGWLALDRHAAELRFARGSG
jgi:hypothetical protein